RDDAAPGVIADVTAHDVRLVQVDVVVIHADAVVVVDMAVRQDNVAVPAGQVNAVQRLTDHQSGDGQLHRPGRLQADRLRVSANDFQAVHGRGPLVSPDVLADSRRVRGAGVSADELECRPRAGHHDPGGAIAD